MHYDLREVRSNSLVPVLAIRTAWDVTETTVLSIFAEHFILLNLVFSEFKLTMDMLWIFLTIEGIFLESVFVVESNYSQMHAMFI